MSVRISGLNTEQGKAYDMPMLPLDREQMLTRGWDRIDFLFITGDAYVDHPSFGAAILTRLLEDDGYRVGVCAQPDISDRDCLKRMGRPQLGVLVSSGVVDSMVNNYTSSLRHRRDDRYSPGGRRGKRPDRALIAYCKSVREQFGDIPLIIGGVEGSLRRFAHYDYWSDSVQKSILADTGADILVYGMGEKPLQEIVSLLAKGVNVRKINSIRGTCVLRNIDELPGSVSGFIRSHSCEDNASDNVSAISKKYVLLPSFQEVSESKRSYAEAFRMQYEEQDPLDGRTLIQMHPEGWMIQNPPSKPLSVKEMDKIYGLPFTRVPNEIYTKQGGIPAISEVSASITAHRGCYGGCYFCAITMHQGRIVQKRSNRSILQEAESITGQPEFKGYIHDIGGPTANFHERACARQEKGGVCGKRACMSPEMCPALRVDQSSYTELLREARKVPGVKKVFVRSGVRFDYLLADRNSDFLEELCEHHVSGQLKVAPEHVSDNVLRLMGKPGSSSYEEFREAYRKMNIKLGKDQYLVPYLISGHPGSTLNDAIELALHIKHNKVMPEQVQDFYPTPGSVSTTMYHTGLDPFTMDKIHIPDIREKRMQRALLQFSLAKNRKLVIEALNFAGRSDLIGYGPECLVRPQTRKSSV